MEMSRTLRAQRSNATLVRDDFSSNRHPALALCLSMIFSENRYPLFGIMRCQRISLAWRGFAPPLLYY
jgi:hypothetical protein